MTPLAESERRWSRMGRIGAWGILWPLIALLWGCEDDPKSPGIEFMPDMYRSPAIEAFVDYEKNDSLSARHPAEGTVPFSPEHVNKDHNPNFPYTYPDNFSGYEKAGKELSNPIELTPEVLNEGERLFKDYCTHCHGAKGKGAGAMVQNGAYPPPPDFTGNLKDLTEGKMFHSLTYGKNLMPSHATQLNKTERWKVIHYVNVLQEGGQNPFEEADKQSKAEEDRRKKEEEGKDPKMTKKGESTNTEKEKKKES